MNFVCEFSYKHYFEVIDSIKEKYYFGTISEFHKLLKIKKFILLRHDVDVSLDYALKLAEFEFEHGVKSTYFILLHSDYYNALSKSNQHKIKKISDLGHEIGLHYDTNFLTVDKKNITLQLKREVQILSDLIGKEIISIAQHNPSITNCPNFESDLRYVDSRDPEITKEVKYISDSVHNWREGCMCKHIKNFDRLQILTHPIWWSENSKSADLAFEQLKEDEVKKIDTEIRNSKIIFKNYFNLISLHKNLK